MPSATAHAQQQKEVLAELFDTFEVLEEGPHSDSGNAEGFFISFRFKDENENSILGRSTCLICGPVACHLLITRLDQPDQGRDRICDSIARTLTLLHTNHLPVTGNHRFILEQFSARYIISRSIENVTRLRFPRSCIELTPPPDWEATVENNEVIFRKRESEIRLTRELGESQSPETWLADRLARIHACNSRILASTKGETDRGSYTILYYESNRHKTWGTSTTDQNIEILLEDQVSIAWKLSTAQDWLTNAMKSLGLLLTTAIILQPEEWETPVKTTWINHVLKGQWESHGPTTYVKATNPPVLLSLCSEEAPTASINSVRQSISKSLRHLFSDDKTLKGEEVDGMWHNFPAFHCTLAGESRSTGHQHYLRGFWIKPNQQLHSLVVQGSQKSAVDELFSDLLAAVTL